MYHENEPESEENEDKLYHTGMGKAEGNTIFPRSFGLGEELHASLSQSNIHWLRRKRPFLTCYPSLSNVVQSKKGNN